MLPGTHRLRAAEVRAVIASGRHGGRGAYLSIKYVPHSGPLRSAVVVSKKVAKGAVMRNRLRRAAYRALSSAKGHGHAVFFVQKIPSTPLSPAFANDIAPLLTKIS